MSEIELPADSALDFQRGGYYVEPADLVASNVSVGTRLWVAAQVFFYGSLLFTFFYLRELNSSGLWHPAKVDAPTGTGVAILVCVLAAAAIYWLGMEALRAGRVDTWRAAAAATMLLALGALAVQCYQWATLPFPPGGSGFAGVFVAWTGLITALGIGGGLYTLETTLVTSLRHRRTAPGPMVSPAEAEGGAGVATATGGNEAQAFAASWYLLSIVEVVAFILLYVVG